MELSEIKHQLKKTISIDFTGAVTECESMLSPDSDCFNDLVVIQTQYRDLRRSYQQNLIDHDAFMRSLSKSTTALVELVDRITEYDLKGEPRTDLISVEKPVIDENEGIAIEATQEIFSSVYEGKWKWFKTREKERLFFALAAKRYGNEIWRQYNSMRVFGMTEDVPLDGLFVRVNILEKTQERHRDSVDFLEKNFDREERKIKFGEKRTTKTGIETINTIKNLMVLGKPGAGKSTYLKFLALQSIKQQSDIVERKVPIFITLKDLADKGRTIIQFITDQFRICTLEDASLFVAQLLTAGKCLILLDGLDEVQEERKNDIIQEIIDLSEKYPQNQFVVSCRVAAYNAWFVKFTDVEMSDFNDKQIKAFITKWFHQEPETGKSCWEKLKKEPPLKELAAIPLLLTLLCIAYDENLDFHASRAELYEEAINALLKKWDSSRRIKRFEPYKNLSLARKRSLFSRIAAQTFEEGKYFLKRKEIVKLIAEYVQNIPGIKEEETSDVAGDVFDAIVANHGIFVPRAKGIYSFAHLTFQEYFTARYIVEHSTNGATSALIDNHVNDHNWREVFLLTVSMLGKADQFLIGIHHQANKILKKKPQIKAFFNKLDALILNSTNPFPLFLRKVSALFIALTNTRGIMLFGGLNYTYGLARELSSGTTQDITFYSESFFPPDHILITDNELSSLIVNLLADSLDLSVSFSFNFPPGSVFDLSSDLHEFLLIKHRLVECLNTECYVSNETRQWLKENILELTEEEK